MTLQSSLRWQRHEKFNRQFNIGQTVEVALGAGKVHVGKTRSKAYMIGNEIPVVLVEGLDGPQLLSDCTPYVRGCGEAVRK